jgi:predicted phosphodiesterase
MKRRDFLKTSAMAALSSAAMTLPAAEVFARKKDEALDDPEDVHAFRFRPDGKFKILQLADTHYISGNPKSERALRNVIQMLDEEKPDLVIHTGDIFYGNPAAQSLREILQPMADRKIPFLATLGNHESDFELTREEVLAVIRSVDGNINSPMKPNVSGCSNDVVTLSSEEGLERVFYLFDSGDYIDGNSKNGYDFIRHSQIGWYRTHSERFTALNGGQPLPSMAFFHIPVREFCDGIRDPKRDMIGSFCEEPAASNYNSGLVANFKEMGDVEAIVCGHDHDNDYVMKYQDMFYMYGRFSGCDNVYNRVGRSGARVFEFTKGQKGFRTYLRIYDQGIQQELMLHRAMKHLLGDIPKE